MTPDPGNPSQLLTATSLPEPPSGFVRGRDLLLATTLSEMKASVRGAALHYFWWLLDPLLMMAIYVFVIDVVLERGHERYPLFLFCALLPWKAISNSLSHAAVVMRNSRGVLTSVAFPRAVLPASVVLAQTIYMSSGFLVTAGLLAFYGVSVSAWLLAIPLVVICQLALSVGLALALSIFGAYYKDADNFTRFLLQLWFFGSPTLYSLEQVPSALRPVMAANPLAGICGCYRSLIIDGAAPSQVAMLSAGAGSALALCAGVAVFRRYQHDLPKIA